jgi:protein O-mannosyl-transferase
LRDKILLAAAALLAFGLALAGSFHFDDYSLFASPAITAPGGWREVWKPLATRPLTNFTFWLDYRLGGRNPVAYHAVGLALHIAAVLLLFAVLQLLVPRAVALTAALLFAVDPIQTQAVAYVFERGTVLAAVLSLAALLYWLRGRHWIAVAWFAAALLAKEECAAFPVFLLLMHVWRKRPRRELAPIGAMIALALAAGLRVVFATAVIRGAGAGFAAGVSPWTYASYQGQVILRYLRMLVLPWGFTIDPAIGPTALWMRALAWLVVAAAAGVALWRFRRHPLAFWFLGGLVLLAPSSSIFPAADLAADRRMYLPMIAFSVCLALLLDRLDRRVVAALAVVLIGISIRYSLVWRTEHALWSEAVARAPRKVRPRIQLARTLPPAAALRELEQARAIAPDDPDIDTEEGRIYMSAGMPAQALGEFGRALARSPHDPLAMNNRGVALLALGQASAARQDFERALRRDPCLFDARLNLLRMGVTTPGRPQCRYTPDQQAALTGR